MKEDLDQSINQLEAVFKANGRPTDAIGMSKYMKNLFPYVGLKKPLRAELEQAFVAEWKKLPFEHLEYIIHSLWNRNEREFQYTALVLLRSSKIYKKKESLGLLEWLLVNKSWWDSVDAIAAQLVGPYFLCHPQFRDLKINEWKNSDNMWLNRTTLIFQLKHKKQTDIPLLFDLLRHFAPEKEFFIKKAVGWALRQLSYTYPDEVVRFVEQNQLQPLSKKEALKALLRNK